MPAISSRITLTRRLAPLCWVLFGIGLVVSGVGFPLVLSPRNTIAEMLGGWNVVFIGLGVLAVATVMAGLLSLDTPPKVKHTEMSGKTLAAYWRVILGFGVALIIIAPADSSGWLVLNLLLLMAFKPLLVVCHEAGHAGCAWLLGLRVFRVTIGAGRTIMEVRWRQSRFEMKENLFDGGGETHFGHPNLRWFRLKYFLAVLAGPLANASLVAVFLAFVHPWPRLDLFHLHRLEPGLALLVGNLSILVWTLLPYEYARDKQPQTSDGWRLCAIAFLPRKALEEAQVAYFLVEAQECLRCNDLAAAAQWYARARRHAPDDVSGQVGVGTVFLLQKEFQKAREQWWAALRRPNGQLPQTVLLWNNIAVADLLLALEETPMPPDVVVGGAPATRAPGDLTPAQLLLEADEFSGFAYTNIKVTPLLTLHIQGTRGCVLVELGKYEVGLPMLHQALEQHESANDKAFCACFIALAKARMGHDADSKKYLALARSLAPQCIALDVVRRKLTPNEVRLDLAPRPAHPPVNSDLDAPRLSN